ncbi:type V secretory pathway, adhesin AidA [Ectopseudomonas mendocina]|nr:type V secretory pathway, adhesin AidA [Pseudomonas mendocina]
MTRIQPPWRLAQLAAAVTLATLTSAPATAVIFQIGEFEGQFDSHLAIGASWALRNPDPDLLHDPASDDGRRNFKKGETFSKVFKGVHDLELRYRESGVFLRGKYWYDFELKDESRLFSDIDEHNRKEAARSSGAQLLDAFVYHNYLIGELPGTTRVGKQVVSWGESTFIQGGINTINPVDVSAFRRPGSEIKEGLIPVNMLYLSQNLTEELSVEGFYQLEWDQTVIDNCGTFFSPTDALADGCSGLYAPSGSAIPRIGDRDARDEGQWGAALRWFAPKLDSEFAAYFINYHSRMSYFSTVGATAVGDLGSTKYFVEYPEDIQLYGLSISTMLPTGTTLAGEISYRPNMPVQISPVDLVLASSGIPPLSPVLSGGSVQFAAGEDITGYRRKEVTQAQMTASHFFDQVMGADRLTVVGEVGVVHVGGLESRRDIRYGRATAFGQGELSPDNGLCMGLTNAATPNNCTDDGFVTSTSWGYRVRAIWEYSNLIPGVDLRPNLAWSHDVRGYGSEPGFNEGAKAISVGIDASVLSTYSANLSYTDFFGGDYNTNIDRDFVALSFGVAF